MQSWNLTAPGQSGRGICTLVDAIGTPEFGPNGLRGLNDIVQAASWSVYQVWRDRPPRLHLSASLGVTDTTNDCFHAYAQGLYLRDRSFDAVASPGKPGHVAMLRMSADEAPNAEHRQAIYLRHGVLERLSVARLEDDGSLLAVNLYHHTHQGRFSPSEIEHFGQSAPLVLTAVRRHLAITPPVLETAPASAGDSRVRERLQAHCAALTARELDVCERVLRGWSYDGIAADLTLSVATVKTYRARAFARLGLHFKSELFALLRD